MEKLKSDMPVFPKLHNGSTLPSQTGIDIRDYFAAKAMQALIARYGDRMHIVDADGRASLHFVAYDHADAMLKAREQWKS